MRLYIKESANEVDLRHRPPQEIGAMGHRAFVAGEGCRFSRQLLLAQFDGIQGVSLVVKALDTSISRRVASLTLTLKYPQNSYAELRPQGFNPGCCRQ